MRTPMLKTMLSSTRSTMDGVGPCATYHFVRCSFFSPPLLSVSLSRDEDSPDGDRKRTNTTAMAAMISLKRSRTVVSIGDNVRGSDPLLNQGIPDRRLNYLIKFPRTLDRMWICIP